LGIEHWLPEHTAPEEACHTRHVYMRGSAQSTSRAKPSPASPRKWPTGSASAMRVSSFGSSLIQMWQELLDAPAV
jgi:hypothetical protein